MDTHRPVQSPSARHPPQADDAAQTDLHTDRQSSGSLKADLNAIGPSSTGRTADHLRHAVNSACDRTVRTTIRLFGRPLPVFRFCGAVGFSLAVALGGGLARHQHRSLAILGLLALAAAVTFFVLAFGAKILTGEERLVYYQHELAIFAVSALVLAAIDQPVLAYLDLTALGVGTFLACGRVGCFLAGCCHGRPSRCGVRYGPDHVAIGFPAPFLGVRLLPVQLVEALWAAAAVAVGTWSVLHGAPAGTAWCSYVVLYDLGRFTLEFFRGDAERPYHLGFSSAQWFALVLTALVVAGETAGVLPQERWHTLALIALVLAMIAVVITRRLRPTTRDLTRPRHLMEIAEIVNWGGDAPLHTPSTDIGAQIRLEQTSLGVRISIGKTGGDRITTHYGISLADREISAGAAQTVASRILVLKHPTAPSQFLPGRAGVFHLLAFDPPASSATSGNGHD
jgi:hypothetical protein